MSTSPHAETTAPYTIYGDLRHRETLALASVLRAKRLSSDLVEESPSLSLALEARVGGRDGPYLRTPEGFVLSDLHAMLEWIERVQPTPALLPETPVRRTCARMLEDWIELWLVHWPRRSWGTLERLGEHLARSDYLLGRKPVRADWILAAWLETEVLIHKEAREALGESAPRLLGFGSDLLGESHDSSGSTKQEGDDAIPISLLDILAEVGADYHLYLIRNYEALRDGLDSVRLDLGLGSRDHPVQYASEIRRTELARELRALDRRTRRRVEGVLDPLGAWHALTLPPILEEVDPADPRSL